MAPKADRRDPPPPYAAIMSNLVHEQPAPHPPMRYPTTQAGGGGGGGGAHRRDNDGYDFYVGLPDVSGLSCKTHGDACTCNNCSGCTCDHIGCSACTYDGCSGIPAFECGTQDRLVSGGVGLAMNSRKRGVIACFALVVACLLAVAIVRAWKLHQA